MSWWRLVTLLPFVSRILMRRALRREDALGRNCSLPEDAPDGFLKSCIWLSSRMGMMKSKRKILLLTGVHSQNKDKNSCSVATAHNKWRKHKYPPTGASNQFMIGPSYIWGLNVFLSDQIMLRRLCNQCKWQNIVVKCASNTIGATWLVAKFESYKRTRVLTAWFWSACGICQCFLTGKLEISLGPLRNILLYSVPYVIR